MKSSKMRAMDTKTLAAKIEELLTRLRGGDKTAIDAIVAAYNSRPVPPGSTLVQGWGHIER